METVLHRFVRLLRLRGVRISTPEALDAMACAGQAGMLRDREQLRAALRAALIKDQRDEETFVEIFDRFFQGSVPDRRFVAAYGYKGRIVGAVTFNQSKWLAFYARQIERVEPFPPTFRTVDQPAEMVPIQAGFPHQPIPTQDATVVVTGHDPSERHATLVPR